jgi:hypothetical protein
MSNILFVLEKWGINISKNEDYIEHLRNSNPYNFFYIDRCPLKVGEKHNQIDIFFQEVLEDTISKEKFLNLELKYRSILIKLWLYNKLFVESNIYKTKIRKKHNVIDKQFRKLYTKLFNKFAKNDFVNVENKDELELLVQLSTKDAIYAAFYFEEYELLVIPSWSCLITYFNDLSKLELVEKIVNTEGLYLRPFIETK